MIAIRRIVARAAVAALLLSPLALEAQGGRPSQLQVERTAGPQFGLRAVSSTERPDGWGWGAQVRIPIDWNLALEPSADVFNVNGVSWRQFNVDLLALDRRGWLYGRLGVAASAREGLETRYGVNAGVGTDFPFLFETPLRPFAEARWSIIDGNAPLRILLGANITFGKR